MNYLSVCSGIEAASVAWKPLGWTPIGFSEIAPFPSAVLAARFPGVQNFGDLTDYEKWNIEPGTVDVLIGGTPCQSFSVAGLRKGIHDPRGNLALIYMGLIDRLRPRWIIWENVPGVLSSNGGRDFGTFVGALDEIGYSFAWRILDAKHFGVPQRRRRLFLVGHYSDWRGPAAVLFESARGGRNPSKDETKGKVSPTIPARTSSGGGFGTDFDLDGGLIVCVASGQANAEVTADGISPTLSCLHEVPFFVSQSVSQSRIRRFTTLECERLQGFPDDWTNVIYRKKTAADGPRYKALGNSMAVPVVRWIGKRIQAVDSMMKEFNNER